MQVLKQLDPSNTSCLLLNQSMHGYAQHLNVSVVILEGLSLACMEVYRKHIKFNVISIDTAPT